MTEFDATFQARDARAVALQASVGLPIAAALDALRDLRDSGELLRLADGTATTGEHRACERDAVRVAERLAASTAASLDTGTVDALRLDAELRRRGGRLSGEQHRALKLACGNRRLIVIEGQAGTGKSTTLTAIARAHQLAGGKLIVTSTAALAAQRLARELDQAGVNTIASHHPLPTVIHDLGAHRTRRQNPPHQRTVTGQPRLDRTVDVISPQRQSAIRVSVLSDHDHPVIAPNDALTPRQLDQHRGHLPRL